MRQTRQFRNRLGRFTQFDLLGFGSETARVPLAMDNLVLTIVPEPAPVSLLAAGFGLISFWFSRRKAGRE